MVATGMTRWVIVVLAIVAVSLVLATLVEGQRTSKLQLVLPANNIPEGFDFFPVHVDDDGDDDDTASRFVVSNLAGSPRSVTDNGTSIAGTRPWSALPSAIYAGVQYDKANDYVYIVKSHGIFPTSFTPQASVVILRPTGEQVAEVAFDTVGSQTFKSRLLNDVVQDQYGNLYVTDSLQGSIYFVDNAFKAGSLFFQDPIFLPADQLVGINGIEYFAGLDSVAKYQEYLLVTVTSNNPAIGGLYKVPILGPRNFIKTNVAGSLTGLDGIVYDERTRRVYLVSQTANAVLQLASPDDWVTAVIEKTYPVLCATPTSIVYIAHPYEDAYVTCANQFGSGPYYIQRVKTDNLVSDSAVIVFSSAVRLSMSSVFVFSLVLVLALVW